MPNGEGFVFESVHVDLEIYRLLSMVLASPILARRARSEPDGRRLEWLRQIEFAEVSRALVSIAAIVRTNTAEIRRSIELSRPVGILHPDSGDTTRVQVLHLREACNKILHADQVEAVRIEGEPDHPPPLAGC